MQSWIPRSIPAVNIQQTTPSCSIAASFTGKTMAVGSCCSITIIPIIIHVSTNDSKQIQDTVQPLTLSPRKARILACRFLTYSHKTEISAWKFWKKLLKMMLCLGALGLRTPCCGSSGVRGSNQNAISFCSSNYIIIQCHNCIHQSLLCNHVNKQKTLYYIILFHLWQFASIVG